MSHYNHSFRQPTYPSKTLLIGFLLVAIGLFILIQLYKQPPIEIIGL